MKNASLVINSRVDGVVSFIRSVVHSFIHPRLTKHMLNVQPCVWHYQGYRASNDTSLCSCGSDTFLRRQAPVAYKIQAYKTKGAQAALCLYSNTLTALHQEIQGRVEQAGVPRAAYCKRRDIRWALLGGMVLVPLLIKPLWANH